jgi:hypothetical protein
MLQRDESFPDLVRSAGRVRVRHSRNCPVPVPLSVAITARVQALRHTILPRFDAEFKASFPFVVVEPVCWTMTDDARPGVVHACVGPALVGSHWLLTVFVSAASLLALPTDLLEGVLAFEFLQYVSDTVAAYEAHQSRDYVNSAARNDETELSRLMEEYRQRNPEWRLASEAWLSDRVRALLGRAKNADEPAMRAAYQRIFREWTSAGLPTLPVPKTFFVGGDVTLDLHVVDRHRILVAPDPPIKPFESSARWVESGPSPIIDDLSSAVLMVRVGLAYNALTAQFRATKAAETLEGAARMAFILTSLVNTAALTNEALRVARSGMFTLRRYAEAIGAKTELLERMGKLLAGRHPAAEVLARARNKLGFHWDEPVVEQAVREFGRNKNLVWFEMGLDGIRVERLAADVLAHTLIPQANESADSSTQQATIREALEHVNDALNLVIEFFTACTYGYLLECRASRTRERVALPDGSPTAVGGSDA